MSEKKILLLILSFFVVWLVIVYLLFFSFDFFDKEKERYINKNNINQNETWNKINNEEENNVVIDEEKNIGNDEEKNENSVDVEEEKEIIDQNLNKCNECDNDYIFLSNFVGHKYFFDSKIISITRQELASLYASYYSEEIWDIPNDIIDPVCDFDDKDEILQKHFDDIMYVCSMWVLKWDWDNFYPNWIVSVEEILIWASRILSINDFEEKVKFYWNNELWFYQFSLENLDKNIINEELLQNYFYIENYDYNDFSKLSVYIKYNDSLQEIFAVY